MTKQQLIRQIAKLEAQNAALIEELHTDQLTGALNRRALERDFDGNKSLMLVDLNYFKDINDTHGHRTGDDALVKAVEILRNENGEVYRIGGDEFVVLLDKICDLIADCGTMVFEVDAPYEQISMSCGISNKVQLSEALADADAKMFNAKGRSRRSRR